MAAIEHRPGRVHTGRAWILKEDERVSRVEYRVDRIVTVERFNPPSGEEVHTGFGRQSCLLRFLDGSGLNPDAWLGEAAGLELETDSGLRGPVALSEVPSITDQMAWVDADIGIEFPD